MLLRKSGLCLLAAFAVFQLTAAQDTSSPSARWIPTDLNYAVISNLRQDRLSNVTSQIAGYSTLGVIPLSDVQAWLRALQTNPSFAQGTVRWQPGVASKCGSGTVGCYKSIRVTVLEYDYTIPNGSDCRASALIAADAILPPSATLDDPTNGQTTYLPANGPVQYQILAAPNSTAANCTYVVQYPRATQTLANQLCNTQNGSCTDSPCVPCNANQTISGADPVNNCTPQNGIAPAMVAAIEGAAQCLSLGGQGRFQCQVGFTANNSACSQMHCFPGDAEVRVEGGKVKRMEDVRIGDRVQVAKQDGALAYEDVYFFGHQDASAVANFVQLTLKSRGRNSERVLELSTKHFLPASKSGSSWSQAQLYRAQDVSVRDIVWVATHSGTEQYEVAAKQMVTKQGLWNPYTLSGNIVVNGVVASAHSEWIFDGVFEYFGRSDLLPAFYQVTFYPST